MEIEEILVLVMIGYFAVLGIGAFVWDAIWGRRR